MINFEQLNIYKQYLNTIQNIIDERFEDQKEYIKCKQGCSHCCEKGTYPMCEAEFQFLLLGLLSMETNEQQKVLKRIQNLKEDYSKTNPEEKFLHRCPFLNEENLCTIYDFRALICRTFGLLIMSKDGKVNMPFCQELGLNYAGVYNEETNSFDENYVKEHKLKNSPKAYPLSLKYLLDKDLFEDNSLEFGEIKPLIEWL